MISKIQYNSPVILSFSLIAIVVFMLDNLLQGALHPLFTLSPYFNFLNPISYFTLISYTVGHSSMEHLWGNLTFLLLIGPVIEEKYGSATTLIMILVTAIATAIVHILIMPYGLLGASGIVFMFIILVSFTNVTGDKIPLTFIIVAILFIGKELINSFNPNDNISQFAHIFGGVIGSVFGFGIRKRANMKERE